MPALSPSFSLRRPPSAPSQASRLARALAAGLLAFGALTLGHVRPAPAAPAASQAPVQGRRVLSLAPATTEMCFALGLGQRVVGRSSYCNYPRAALALPAVGGPLDLNEERAVALHPDVIVTVEGDQTRTKRLASLTGAKLLVLPTRHVDDIWRNLRTLGDATGTRPDADRLVKRLQAQLPARKPAASQGPSVFYMVWNQPLMAAGPDSYLNDLITLAGGRNAVPARAGLGSYPTIAWEALLASDPDVILGPTNMAPALTELARRYPHLKAVRAHRVRPLPDDLISRPGPRVAEALAQVRQALR